MLGALQQGLARCFAAALPAVKNRSVSTCWVQNYSLNSPCKKSDQNPVAQVGFSGSNTVAAPWLEHPGKFSGRQVLQVQDE